MVKINMDMPQNCVACLARGDVVATVCVDGTTVKERRSCVCKIENKEFATQDALFSRMEWCPLIECEEEADA